MYHFLISALKNNMNELFAGIKYCRIKSGYNIELLFLIIVNGMFYIYGYFLIYDWNIYLNLILYCIRKCFWFLLSVILKISPDIAF
ncbi:MAG: hypothetical protein DBY16_02215 [Coprobacter sp.]|nr:MAG: hypothetical protein DBY16_02215 [Coprobacter sp.]